MAWRIAKYITDGELDNRQKGLVVGSLRISGQTEPLKLELRGNFLRDLAGRTIRFRNPAPVTGDALGLDALQVGFTGDMTASRKDTVVKIEAPEKPQAAGRAGDLLPTHTVNKLFLEWFSETNGRIVIEATDFPIELGPPAWSMTAEEETQQLAANRESFRQWLEHLSELESTEEEASMRQPNRPMSEFEWEKVFKDSDIKNEKLSEVLEKYHGHPDSEMLIAREMGWMWVEEELEAQERGVFGENGDEDVGFDEDEEDEEFVYDDTREPDPLREGLDWVRDEDGSVEHPLALKALRFSSGLWKHFEETGQLSDAGDSRIFEWVGLIESAGVRLSNTLGDVAYGDEVDNGYIIAGLKRSVHILHQALGMLQTIEPLNLLPADVAKDAQKTLFGLREDILAMMKQYRARH